jgi:hypothetical protein
MTPWMAGMTMEPIVTWFRPVAMYSDIAEVGSYVGLPVLSDSCRLVVAFGDTVMISFRL